jgi:GNAT superfamily N-acetyltransferase
MEVTITYLEMRRRPSISKRLPAPENTAIFQAHQPTISFYRYLYCHVGGPWLWYERRAMDNETLAAIIHDPAVSLHVLYLSGVPAGYVELDSRVGRDIELAYFGLLPEFIGRGLGPWFLNWALDTAWNRQPSRVWVNTCNLDHPKALECYQQAGFETYRQEFIRIRDPRHEPYWDTTPPPEPNSQ